MIPRCVAMTGDRCGEGAAWHAEEQAVYWCDINRFLVHRFDLATASVKTWAFEEPVVAVSLTRDPGQLLLAMASRLLLWRPSSGSRRDLGFSLEGSPGIRLNDGRADRQGNFWIGSMQNNVRADGDLDRDMEWAKPGKGTLFRFAPDGTHTVRRRHVGISNTICWSPDGRIFYFGDTLENEIRAYDFDGAAGRIVNERPFFSGFGRGGPDGSAIDAEGYLWNCRYGGGCVVRVAPDGRIDRVVEMPCTDITTCTFGGGDLKTLYITTAGMGGHPGERLAGSLFALDCEAPGLAENRAGF
jgi:sugar lactone lactonase YvrE